MPQVKNIFPNLTVQENLELRLTFVGIYGETLEEVLKLIPILWKKEIKYGQLVTTTKVPLEGHMIQPEFILSMNLQLLSPKMYNETFESIQKIKTLELESSWLSKMKKALQISDRGCVLSPVKIN